MRRKISRNALGLALFGAVASALLTPWNSNGVSPARAATTTSSTHTLTPGLTLTTIRYPTDPQEVRLLTVTPAIGPRVDIAQASPTFGERVTTSILAQEIGAIAAVNGDFKTSYEAPLHATMIDGEMWTSGFGGSAFAMTSDGRRAWIGRPKLVSTLRPIHVNNEFQPIDVATWNAHLPQGGEVGVYTPRGGSDLPPPGVSSPSSSDPYWCEALLTPVVGSDPSWTSDAKSSIGRRYKVTAQPQPCPQTRLGLGSDPGNVVIASRASFDGGRAILRLSPGDIVKLSWGFRGWPGAIDVVGGSPPLVDDGQNVGPPNYSGAPHILYYNPRTAVGITSGCGDTLASTACNVLILTDDGRQTDTGWSKGWQMPALADELIKHGAVDAMNFDGGGSTTMWTLERNAAFCQTNSSPTGCLVNRPSYSTGEREVIQAFVVLPGDDPGTPASLR